MKRGIKILIWTDVIFIFALGMIGPIYAIFVQKIGGDILDASWAYFAFTMSSGFMLYLFGKIEDKSKHREWFVVLGYGFNSLGAFLYIFVNSQIFLIINQIILGLGNAVLSPAFDAVFSDNLSPAEKASEWGDWEGFGLIALALSSLAGGYIAKEFGFRVLFVAMFIISLTGLFASLNILRKKRYLSSRA